MNCYKCGEEIKEPAGYICQPCLDEVLAEAVEELVLLDDEGQKKKDGETPLSPREAVIAMLNGEELEQREPAAIILHVKWDEPCFMHRQIGARNWLPRPLEARFEYFYRKPVKKTRPMTAFECLAWVNSSDSQGWLVSVKYIGNDFWGDWDIPQRFKYDTQENYSDPGVVSYRRARVLPDKSGIDESTIQGFVMEDE